MALLSVTMAKCVHQKIDVNYANRPTLLVQTTKKTKEEKKVGAPTKCNFYRWLNILFVSLDDVFGIIDDYSHIRD